MQYEARHGLCILLSAVAIEGKMKKIRWVIHYMFYYKDLLGVITNGSVVIQQEKARHDLKIIGLTVVKYLVTRAYTDFSQNRDGLPAV